MQVHGTIIAQRSTLILCHMQKVFPAITLVNYYYQSVHATRILLSLNETI